MIPAFAFSTAERPCAAFGPFERKLEPDPAIVAALAEPIITDPDLAAQNRGNATIVIGAFGGVPAWTRDPDFAAARAAAVRLAGGSLQTAADPGAANSRPSSRAYPPGVWAS